MMGAALRTMDTEALVAAARGPLRHSIRWTPQEHTLRPRAVFWTDNLRCPRMGVCLHYDGSQTDTGGITWLQDERVKAGYQFCVWDDGSWGLLAPLTARVWHAGRSRSSNPELLPYPNGEANSAFYGITILNGGREDVTSLQMITTAWLTARLFTTEGWGVGEGWRVTGHSAECWPRARKKDPEGSDPLNPILSPNDVRPLLPLFVDIEPFDLQEAA